MDLWPHLKATCISFSYPPTGMAPGVTMASVHSAEATAKPAGTLQSLFFFFFVIY